MSKNHQHDGVPMQTFTHAFIHRVDKTVYFHRCWWRTRCCNSITSRITSFSTAIKLNWPKLNIENLRRRIPFLWNARFVAFYSKHSFSAVHFFDNFTRINRLIASLNINQTSNIYTFKAFDDFSQSLCYPMRCDVCVGFHDEFVIQRSNHKRVDQLVITY